MVLPLCMPLNELQVETCLPKYRSWEIPRNNIICLDDLEVHRPMESHVISSFLQLHMSSLIALVAVAVKAMSDAAKSLIHVFIK